MPSKYVQAESFTLPKEKFPQCLVARIQTHECIRISEDSDWKCERRPKLLDPIAACLVWANFDHPCKTDWGWPVIRYVNINIDPATHTVEPALRCIYRNSGPHLAGVVHSGVYVDRPVTPAWNKPENDLGYPPEWRDLGYPFEWYERNCFNHFEPRAPMNDVCW